MMSLVVYRFGELELDVDQVELRSSGVPVAIEPQVFDVLRFLVEHRERVVTKEELLDNVWGDRFVSESALTSRIKSARRAVGDSGRHQHTIRTVHGRGYRFVAPVEAVVEHAALATKGSPPAAVVESDAAIVVPATADPTTDPTSTPGAHLDDRWPLVGRHAQIDTIAHLLHDGRVGGVLITGPAGIGKTRIARDSVELSRRAGWATAEVNGHAEARDIPLAALAHLLPDGVADTGDHDLALARTLVLQRSRTALTDRGEGPRLVILVDDVDQVDDLSLAILGSWIAAGNVFALLTQRTAPDSAITMHELVRSGRILRVDLDPLDDTDLDVLLYRVLQGPIESSSLLRLTELSGGSPGVLQMIVESCLADRSLSLQAGVWRLTASPPTTTGLPGPDQRSIARLGDGARRAAELLAVAGDIDLRIANDLAGEAAIDELDDAHLLAVSETPHGTRVALDAPHLRLLLLDEIGELRSRRLRSRLAEAIARNHGAAALDRVHMVRWKLEVGDEVGPDSLLRAARVAIDFGDGDSADLLLDELDRAAPCAGADHLRAELAFRRGQMDHAESLLAAIDLAELPPEAAAGVVRRLATIQFHVRGRFDAALDSLAEAANGFPVPHRHLLDAHWLGLQAFYGRADLVDRRGSELLGSLEGSARLEVLRALGLAHSLSGRFAAGLEALDEHDRSAVDAPADAARTGSEVAAAASLYLHLESGALHRAGELVRRHLPVGRRTVLAWLPLAAAKVELAAGRPAAARELLRTPLVAAESQRLVHGVPLMYGRQAQASARLGELSAAEAGATACERSLEVLDGQLLVDVALSAASVRRTLNQHERADALLADAADVAHRVGSTTGEATAVFESALHRPAAHLERLRELVSSIEGTLWSLRLRHIEALTDGSSLDPVRREYEQMGFHHLAGECRG